MRDILCHLTVLIDKPSNSFYFPLHHSYTASHELTNKQCRTTPNNNNIIINRAVTDHAAFRSFTHHHASEGTKQAPIFDCGCYSLTAIFPIHPIVRDIENESQLISGSFLELFATRVLLPYTPRKQANVVQHSTLPTIPHLGTYLSYTYLLTYYFTRRILCDSLFASPSPSPSPLLLLFCSTLSYSLSSARGEWNATNYCALRLTVYSIHEAGRGARTKRRVWLFFFFFCSLSLFFSFFLSPSLRIVTRTRKRQTDRQRASTIFASPRLGRGTALPV